MQCLRRAVEVVGVELHGKPSAPSIVHREIPATANAEVGTFGHEMHKLAGVLGGYLGEDICCAVGGMIVHHDDVEVEVSLLRKSRIYCIGDGLRAIIDWYDDRGLYVKLLLAEVHAAVGHRVDRSTYRSDVSRGSLFHLYLHLAVAGVHVVELLFATLARVHLLLGVEVFVEMNHLALTAHEEPHVVDGSVAIVGLGGLGNILPEQRRAQEQDLSEVKVVAYGTFLIVYHRMAAHGALALGHSVAVEHRRRCLVGHSYHALHGFIAHSDGLRLCAQQHVGSTCMGGYRAEGVRRADVGSNNRLMPSA